MREMKQRRKKERTWAEAARLVLENYSDAPMTPKQILQVIEAEGLKEMSGTSPLACLNAMLHSNSRGGDGLFYKLPGRISLFTLKKDALQWSRNLSVPEGDELEDTADAESCGSNETSTVSGDNDVSLDETSSNASCSTESQSKGPSTARESNRTASQTTKQKRKTGVMLPRVVLTPLKVNGAHMESASGFTGRHADGESSSTSSSSSSSLALCSASLRSRTEINRDPPQLLRGIRKPTAGQMKRNRGEDIDFETPGSILVNTNLRALINSRTFNALPSHFQQQLLYLLPEVDRQAGADGLMRLSGSALNNEFFTHAAQSWRERLADGEFTHEMQVRIRQEMEKEKRVEQWKERFFEDYYGQKLGLTQEESQEQNLVQEDAENRTALSVKGETRLPRGPSTRQRDGHFKKRSLRCRARRSLYKLRDSEQKEASKEPAAAGPDSSLHKDTKPEVDLKKDDLTSASAAVLKPESSELHLSPETSKLHSKSEDLSLATANRIPCLSQESSAREPKDQKRKCFEEAASASFPEKKPRLEDRQSFRNTIESVHSEKPQPTKEEPKVPPIRIQLSRIKPPWVVKGQPAYQICPRIIPNTEPSARGRSGARTLADIKARALQARAQREAAAAAIGGGGGPGGGRNTEGGGGEPSSHRRRRRSKRARRKRSSDLQRAQLLSSLCLNGEKAGSEAAARAAGTNSFASSKQGSFSSKSEGSGVLECTAGPGSGEAQPGDGSPGGQCCGALTASALDSTALERPEESPEQLFCDARTEASSCAASQEGQSAEVTHVVPPAVGLSCPQAQGAEIGPAGGRAVSELRDVGIPTVQLDYPSDVKENPTSHPALLPELPLGGKECHEPKVISRFRFNGSETTFMEQCMKNYSGDSKTVTAGAEEGVPALCDFTHLQAGRESDGGPSNEEQNAESLLKSSLCDGFISQNRIDTSEKLRERRPGTESEDECQPLRETGEFKANGDDEVQSTHGESTDTASDFEADVADENVGMEMCYRNLSCREVARKGSFCQSSTEECDKISSKSSLEAGHLPCVVDFPSVATVSAAPPPQRWGLHAPLPPKPERPSGSAQPKSSDASSPLVKQLLKGNRLLEEVLPVSHANIKVEGAQPPPDKQSESLSRPMERGSSCYFGKESSPDVQIKTSALTRSDDFHPVRSSVDPQEKACGSGAALPGAEDMENQPVPEKHSKTGLTLSCQEQLAHVASASQKPEDTSPRERTFSSCSFEEQKESSKAHRVPQHNPLTNVISNQSPEKLNLTPEPPFLSPNVDSLGPNQMGNASVNQRYVGVQGKKLFGSGFPCNPSVRLHHSRASDQVSAVGALASSKQIPLTKSCASAEGMPAAREEWTSKQHVNTLRGIKNENVLACGSPTKNSGESQKDAAPNPAELREHSQSVPLVMDLPFLKLSREAGKRHSHPLEPSSVPSQFNIKQAFYGKLSKLQLNSTSFNYSSGAPAFPRSLAGSMMQLTHRANFAANHNTSLSVQMFADSSSVEEISFKCSCSLKAMIMCKGCGAFCHDDCIGPSKLCVLCLVVR